MMRFVLKERFEGVDEDGLTFEEVIIKDVENHINSFFYFRKNIIDENGDIDALNMASSGNARFVISCYYKYLDDYVPGELAEKLEGTHFLRHIVHGSIDIADCTLQAAFLI